MLLMAQLFGYHLKHKPNFPSTTTPLVVNAYATGTATAATASATCNATLWTNCRS